MAEDIQIAGTPYLGKLRNPLAVIGLTIITLGIYGIVWYYKVNKELADIGEARGTAQLGTSPVTSLLAVLIGWIVIIPPFVSVYGTCNRLHRAGKLVGPGEGIVPILLWLLWIIPFGWFFAAYFMQNELNGVLQAQAQGGAPAGAIPAASASPAAAAAPGPAAPVDPIAPAAALFIVQAASDVDAPAAFRAVEQLLDDLVATLPRHVRLAYQIFGAEDVGLTIRLPEGNAQATAAAVEAAASGLLGAAEIRSIWRVDNGDDQAELWISLGSVTAKRRPEISARLREQVKAQNRAAEIAVDFGPTRSALPRIGSPFTVTLSGTDLTTLLDQAAAIRERLSKVPGVVDLVTYPAAAPASELRCAVDPDRTARYHIEPDQAAAAAASVIERRTVGYVVGPHDVSLDVAVVPAGDEPSAVANLPIHAPAGMLLPLAQLAEITVSSEPSAVVRQAGRRVVVLGADAVGDPGAVFARIRAACDEIKLPAGIAITFSDERSTQ